MSLSASLTVRHRSLFVVDVAGSWRFLTKQIPVRFELTYTLALAAWRL